MSERIFSSDWYRVAPLTPRLRGHAAVHRHVYRGRVWYVLQDEASRRLHRFTPAANAVIGLMDGRRTVQAIWDAVCETLGDDAPTQDEVIDLLGRLFQADLLQTQARPDAQETGRRQHKGRRAAIGQRVKNPMSLRIPLFDPDRLLDRLQPLARALFSPFGVAAWLVLVVLGLGAAASNADALAAHAAARLFTIENLALMALLYPLVKLFHELGHGLAVKRWGGRVHETGVMLLVLAPLPYVDASGAAAFADKYRRIAVSAAGILVEVALAAGAALVWVNVASGTVRDAAFDVMLIGSVSTLLFNGNPLLRFDGYYVLSDLVEIPNLAQRSRSYLGYLVLRHVFGSAAARSPVSAPGEAPWLLFYGIASSLYRLLVAITIIGFVAGRFFVLGIVLAALVALQMLVVPLVKHALFVVRSPLLARRRARAVGLASGAVAAAVLAVALAPVPLATHAEGVVWLPDDARVRAGGSGFVRRVLAASGERVDAGQVLIELEDPLQEAQIAVMEAQARELEVEHALAAFRDRVKAEIVAEQLAGARERLASERERAARLTVRSSAAGVLELPAGAGLIGRHVRQGDELAVVVDRGSGTVRAVVEQPDIALVRERPGPVQARLADRLDTVLPARLAREVPAAHYLLPSRVLGSDGGGRIPVEAGDRRGLKVTRKVFQVELELPQGIAAAAGQRVYLRFDHGDEPLARQWARRLQQLFLRSFGVGV